MANILELGSSFEHDNVIRRFRKLSSVIDENVKELEDGLREPTPLPNGFQFETLLRRLSSNKHIQDERRSRLSQISNRRERKEENRQRNKQSNVCSQCGIKVNLEDITTFAVCRSCDETICRSRHCSDWDRQTGYWECLVCIKSRDSQVRAGEWILDQLNRRFKVPRSEQSREDVVSYKDAETQSERSFNGSTYSISLEQKERVRQFLEEVIAEVVGGSLDEIPVTQLNRHPEYLPVWDHECPGVTHLNLKRLIQKVMAEAMRLPDLFNQSGIPPRPEEHMPFFDPKKYEQLVATAVLNKIIETFRNPKNSYADLSSGIHTGSEAENVNEKRVSSMSDQGEPKEDPQYLKEYIQKHKVPLPDLSTAGDSEGTLDDISDCQSVRSSGTEGTWEENWLFKKRKLKAEATASIAMLVPSPTEEVKALIGDKNADEISDLSEAEDVDNDSDNDEDVKELPSVLVQSKTVIGGKNELNSFDDDSSIGDNSLVSNPDSGINVTETKNDALMADEDFVKVDKPIEEAVNVNVKVVEAIVAEAKIVQEEKPVAAPRKASRDEPAAEDVKKPAGDTVPVLEENIPEEKPEGGNVDENNNSPDEHLIPGSLAEREHLKWLKATAEIPNNPYSAEALQKRIKGSTDPTAFTIPTTTNVEQTHDDEINREEALQKEDEKEKTNDYSSAQERSIQVVLGSGEPDYKRYGRDYYINDSKRARGTRKKAESDEVNRQVSSEDSPNMESAEIFIAKPIMVEVEDDDDGQDTVDEPNNINTPSPASTNLLESLPTSEDSDTTRIYDIKTGETRYEVRAKPISPETMKFFAPKKVPDFSPTTEKNKSPSPPEALSPRPIKTEQSTNDIINKLVIEEDVLPVLPSVKKLANVFANSTSPKTETLAPVQRPKNLILNDSPTTPEEEKVATKVSSIMKNQGNQPFKPGYSITGRSLSKQFREELKQSTNSPEEHSNEQQENEDKRTAAPETVESTVENSNSDEGRQSPERPISPVLIPGRLKNNIAFFENLKRH